MKTTLATFATVLLIAAPFAHGSSVQSLTEDDQIRLSDAIFRGTVVRTTSFRNNDSPIIYTRTSIRVDEVFKGKAPAVINVLHRGGELDGVGMSDDLSPRFEIGEERLMFVKRRGDGSLFALQGDAGAIRLQREGGGFSQSQAELMNHLRSKATFGTIPGADITDQQAANAGGGTFIEPNGDSGGPSTNGLLVDASGVPARFPTPDRGEMIPYLVDTDSLPTGITGAQALGAVSNALSAWAAASTFKFVFAGVQSFGMASANISTNDGIFRIQLHNNYGFITTPNVLGEGGSYFTVGLLPTANWGPGGNVAGMEFNQSLCGFVVLNHTNPVMQTLSTFTEVLTHEVGHVIGLAHSSNVITNNPILTNSIMYYLVHADGRGASLNSYDTNVVLEVHPYNTPPYTYERFMDITTSPYGAPNVPGINQVQLRGYDLQSTNLPLTLTNDFTQAGGSFSSSGIVVSYTPGGYAEVPRLDPATGSYYDLIYGRFSDGTNSSPYVTVITLSYSGDSDFPSSDGIPDNWMNQYFGHASPMASDLSRATDDPDRDGLNNLAEYRAGMVPTDFTSAQRITQLDKGTIQFQAKPYELYEVQVSTNLGPSAVWTRFGNPLMPITSTGTVSNLFNPSSPRQFVRILKVP